MGVVHWRFKNIFILLLILFVVTVVIYQIRTETFLDLVYGEGDESGPCNRNIRYLPDNLDGKLAKSKKQKWPAIGLLGPPGSGVVWVRYLIEQMSGLHTGSVSSQHADLFPAEGKTKKVVVVMAHDMTTQYHMSAAIIVYRGMYETVRGQFAAQHSAGTQLEAPMESYYGKDWEKFAMSEGTAWTQRYRDYIDANLPVLVINYDDLEDSLSLKKQLLHISHFLHVPIRHNVLECLVERGADQSLYTKYRPKPLRFGFHPFELLKPAKGEVLNKYRNHTERLIGKTKEGFLPRVHM